MHTEKRVIFKSGLWDFCIDWFISADKERFVAPLSALLRGVGGAVSAHQPRGLYSIETNVDQSPSENNKKHRKGSIKRHISGAVENYKVFESKSSNSRIELAWKSKLSQSLCQGEIVNE